MVYMDQKYLFFIKKKLTKKQNQKTPKNTNKKQSKQKKPPKKLPKTLKTNKEENKSSIIALYQISLNHRNRYFSLRSVVFTQYLARKLKSNEKWNSPSKQSWVRF